MLDAILRYLYSVRDSAGESVNVSTIDAIDVTVVETVGGGYTDTTYLTIREEYTAGGLLEYRGGNSNFDAADADETWEWIEKWTYNSDGQREKRLRKTGTDLQFSLRATYF